MNIFFLISDATSKCPSWSSWYFLSLNRIRWMIFSCLQRLWLVSVKFLIFFLLVLMRRESYVATMPCVCVFVHDVCAFVTSSLLNTISQEVNLRPISYFVCRWNTLSTKTLSFFSMSSKVIWGQHGSNCKHLVNTICHKGNIGQISYLCMCTTFSRRTYSF